MSKPSQVYTVSMHGQVSYVAAPSMSSALGLVEKQPASAALVARVDTPYHERVVIKTPSGVMSVAQALASSTRRRVLGVPV